MSIRWTHPYRLAGYGCMIAAIAFAVALRGHPDRVAYSWIPIVCVIGGHLLLRSVRRQRDAEGASPD